MRSYERKNPRILIKICFRPHWLCNKFWTGVCAYLHIFIATVSPLYHPITSLITLRQICILIGQDLSICLAWLRVVHMALTWHLGEPWFGGSVAPCRRRSSRVLSRRGRHRRRHLQRLCTTLRHFFKRRFLGRSVFLLVLSVVVLLRWELSYYADSGIT